jgi:hypothetical protein
MLHRREYETGKKGYNQYEKLWTSSFPRHGLGEDSISERLASAQLAHAFVRNLSLHPSLSRRTTERL